MSEHVMVDIETLGKNPDALILSIGAVKFDPFSETLGEKFYIAIDPESCILFGRKMDVSTVMWWLDDKQAEARSKMMVEDRIGLWEALDGFATWFGDDKPVWGNGATFDNVILNSAFAACGITKPWKFWNDRCYRTLKNLAPDVKLVREGTYHNALDDAISQAKHMQSVVRELGLKTV